MSTFYQQSTSQVLSVVCLCRLLLVSFPPPPLLPASVGLNCWWKRRVTELLIRATATAHVLCIAAPGSESDQHSNTVGAHQTDGCYHRCHRSCKRSLPSFHFCSICHYVTTW